MRPHTLHANRHAFQQMPKLTAQRGVIVLFTMIAVVLLLIGSVALVRSVDTTQTLAGNMAFKRDLVNQAERGIAHAMATLSASGPLALDTSRHTNLPSNNYSASVLPSNARGIPEILVDENKWTSRGMEGADIVDNDTGIVIRYVIDRMTSAPGVPTIANSAVSYLEGDLAGTIHTQRAGNFMLPVYRISVRVTGPRNTQTYVQSTVSL